MITLACLPSTSGVPINKALLTSGRCIFTLPPGCQYLRLERNHRLLFPFSASTQSSFPLELAHKTQQQSTTMRKEIIIRMHVKSDKCQTKAMKVAAAVSGVESVTLAGGDKSLLLVIGSGVDSNKVVKKLKKKVGEAEIVELRTHDSFEPAALPLPGTKREAAAMAAAARSPYGGHSHLHQWQHNAYAAAPTSPYAYHYYPSPVGGAAGGYGYGYGYGGYGARVSGYSLAAAQSHPANYSPLVERHDYQPMGNNSSSSAAASKQRRQSTAAVPRRGSSSGSGSNSCAIL